jgi:hypothetical protein
VVLGDVVNGADIVTGAAPDPRRKTRIDVKAVGDGTAIDVAAPVSQLVAASIGAGSIRAPGIAALRVAGAVRDSDISVAGDVGTVVVGAFRGSRLFAGYAGPDLPDPTGIYLPAAVHTFRAKSGFEDSRVVATEVGTVTISGLVSDNPGGPFGVYAATAPGSVVVRTPVWFEYDPADSAPQGVGEFEVQAV